jgi:hypothetical protein
MKTLWCKNQENPSDRISHAWAPFATFSEATWLVITTTVFPLFYGLFCCYVACLNLIFCKIPFRSVPNLEMGYSQTRGIPGKEHFFPRSSENRSKSFPRNFSEGILMVTLVVPYWMGSVTHRGYFKAFIFRTV